MIQAFFKGKSSVDFYMDEDFRTSSSIGLLQYLPDDVFWEILRKSCCNPSFTATDFGKIDSFIFWPHNDPENTRNTNFVEPDVWIETEKYDVIIEVKKKDNNGYYPQSMEQWEDQIQSVINEQKNCNYKKDIILIALGGNDNMNPEKALDFPVYKASWYNLLNAIVKVRDEQKNNGAICRILDNVIELFSYQGVMKIQWLNSLSQIEINETPIQVWKMSN